MDKFEKYIIENKASFDEPRHPERGWSQIEKKLGSRKGDFLVYWKVAAMIFFASTLGLLFYQLSNHTTATAETASQVNRFEDFYINQINLKMTEYSKLVGDGDKEDLFEDLVSFDSAYLELGRSFEEMKDQEIAEAMLENLRLRIFILNEQIELIKQGKHEVESYYSS
jgi:hypothetical protein